MIFAAVYGFSLIFLVALIFAIFLTIIYFSKNRVLAELIICGFILVFTINFFYIWFPIKENTELKIGSYLLTIDYNATVPEVSFSLGNKGYLKNLNKIKDSWVGYIYDFDEAVLENLRAKEKLVSLLEEKEVEKNKIEYNKNSGYFIINSQNQLFHLTEEQAKEKLKVKNLNLKNPEKIIRKYGEKKEKSTFYKIIDDYFIPFSDKGIGIIGYEIIKYFAILILILRIIYLRKLLKKRNQEKGQR
ncbi:hypothetical protein [Leptotrichia sp. oral taxon 847]|uniref:hypothetical protein n=1 Tax=Leptotrichia sp. oral taxon 847 TaxID=1785996 RepID=UPI0007681C0E|nr:hypothetical protein [Leptotrichia sp. oral taxon 847]AMD95000.1 hypothetical protein AXF11_04985 [Leptotrichia sp. oral taxon 847]